MLTVPRWLSWGEPAFGCLISFPKAPAPPNGKAPGLFNANLSLCPVAPRHIHLIPLLVSLTRPSPQPNLGARKMSPGPQNYADLLLVSSGGKQDASPMPRCEDQSIVRQSLNATVGCRQQSALFCRSVMIFPEALKKRGVGMVVGAPSRCTRYTHASDGSGWSSGDEGSRR